MTEPGLTEPAGAEPSPADRELIGDVLAAKPRAIARAMSRAETGTRSDRVLMAEIYRHTGGAHVVGLTGVPGSGKSTLVGAMAHTYRQQGRTIGIIAIDPSSPYSGGAILGDRLRMTGLTGDDGVFIRSMATGGALGGLAPASLDMVDILDAAGFDLVLVETVGVGQDEVDIMRAAHSVIVLSAPGLGDDIQAIKAGVLEIADIHAVGKADRPDAGKTVAELKGLVGLGRTARGESDWQVPVISTSAREGKGITELIAALDDHRSHLEESGEMEDRRRRILKSRIVSTLKNIISTRIDQGYGDRLSDLIAETIKKTTDPHSAAITLLEVISRD